MPRWLTATTLILGLMALLLLGGCNGCGGGPERTVLRGGTRHLPLLHDRVLRYQETENGKTTPYTVRMIYAGGDRVRVYDLQYKGVERGFSSLLSNGMQVYFETQQPLTAVLDAPQYREMWLDENLDEGASWDEEMMGTSVVFAGYETVTVPAGTYQNCYKTVSTVQPVYLDSLKAFYNRSEMTDAEFKQLAARANLVVVRWFATRVGLVKEQIGDPEHVRELVAVEREGIGETVAPPEESSIPDTIPEPSTPDSGE